MNGTRWAAWPRLLVLLALLLATPAGVSSAAVGWTARMSVSSAGVEGNGMSSEPRISPGGRFIVFASKASNLVANDTKKVTDTFIRDRTTNSTQRVSIADDEDEANGNSDQPCVSADGRYVAFTSVATNLVTAPADYLGQHIYVRDRVGGTTKRVSVSTSGKAANAWSDSASISDSGRYVVFASNADNLLATPDKNGKNVSDIFLRDLQSNTTSILSVDSSEQQDDWGSSTQPAMSADARYVVFTSGAILAPPTNAFWNGIFLRDRWTGATSRVSYGEGGVINNGMVGHPDVSDDGRYVVFDSGAENLVRGDNNGRSDVLLRDRATGTTRRISVSGSGAQGNGDSTRPALSGDGAYVTYYSKASNLVANDNNGKLDCFRYNVRTRATERMSVSTTGAEGNGDCGTETDAPGWSYGPSINRTGDLVAFGSLATNLVTGDRNGQCDIMLRYSPVPTRTVLTLSAPSSCSYGSLSVTGSLKTGTGTPLSGRTITLQRSGNGTSWSSYKTASTSPAGSFTFSASPTVKTYYRAVYAGSSSMAGATSATKVVLPRVDLTIPASPATVARNANFSAWGYLKPKHASGTYPVKILCYLQTRRPDGTYTYVWKKTVSAKASNYSTYSKYSATLSLPYAGKWALKAYHPVDALNAATYSSLRYVTVN